LMIAATASYQLRTITLETSRADIMWLLVLQYAGLGIGMMPIFSAGLAAIPSKHASIASALNNVIQRAASAFGVAVFTTLLTVLQAQLMADRAALLPATTLTPHLGPAGTPDWIGLYALYQRTHQQVFVAAINNLFLLVAALLALSTLGALLLRSKPAPAGPPGIFPPATEASSPAPANVGPVKHHAVERDSVSSTATSNASPTRQPGQPRKAAALAGQITVTVSTAAHPDTRTTDTSDEETLAETKTAQQTRDQTTGEPDEPTTPTIQPHEELHISQTQTATVQANWDRFREQLATIHRSTDPATALAAKHEQVEQQRHRAEAADQQASPTDDHIEHLPTELTNRKRIEHLNHCEQRSPDQQTRARGRTDDQKPKLGPRQVELARQMANEFDKYGKRRYTIQQIADAFGVTPSELDVGLQCFSRRAATITASRKRIPAKKG
jgi:hypothetical protein